MNQATKYLKVFCDGGARGNPGPAAIGFVVKNQQNLTLFKHQKYIGKATNNQAEYQAVIAALKWLLANKSKLQQPKNFEFKAYHFYLDSVLVANQLSGNYKVKNPHLRQLFATAMELKTKLNKIIIFSSIPRQQNFEADLLVNQALDKKLI